MAAGNTYTQIASTTLGSAGTITFSSIPATYTDLVLVVNGKANSTVGQLALRLNGDTATNYSETILEGDGTTASTLRITSGSYMQLGYYAYFDATNQATGICHIMNYANTTTNKTVLARMNNTALATSTSVGLWRSTAAINSIVVSAATNSFATGTTASLYGITAA
jgi:hypothetical protein